jgi:hypothetical protein
MALGQVALSISALLLPFGPQTQPVETPSVIEILADHDSRYKIAGLKEPVITVHA